MATEPSKQTANPLLSQPEEFPMVFKVDHVQPHAEPTVVDVVLRQQLDAFQGRNPDGNWSWFVQTTRSVSEHDFALLTSGTH